MRAHSNTECQECLQGTPCKKARKQAYAAAWYSRNRDKELVRQAEYRQESRETRNAQRRVKYAAEPEKHREVSRNWQRENKDKRTEWRRANPDKAKAMKQRRRAREVNAPGTVTAEEISALFAKYGKHCPKCGEVKPLTLDHVVPLSQGGSNDISNLQPLCKRCNCSKGRWHVERFEPWTEKA